MSSSPCRAKEVPRPLGSGSAPRGWAVPMFLQCSGQHGLHPRPRAVAFGLHSRELCVGLLLWLNMHLAVMQVMEALRHLVPSELLVMPKSLLSIQVREIGLGNPTWLCGFGETVTLSTVLVKASGSDRCFQ